MSSFYYYVTGNDASVGNSAGYEIIAGFGMGASHRIADVAVVDNGSAPSPGNRVDLE